MRVLIAEDEMEIAKAMKVMLEHSKYCVDVVYNGQDAFTYITTIDYDGIVLDIMMPEMDGLEVLKKIRKEGITTPVMFLTAKGELEDRVTGLNAGADDYLSKPFAGREFVARMKALTRRNQGFVSVILKSGNTELDCNKYELKNGETGIRLNNKEYQMMELFMEHPHHIFSTEHLYEKIWELDTETNLDVIWTYIGFLRKKLRTIGSDIEIRTIRGAGYSLEEIKC